jgi:L-asparaginase II
MIMLPTYPLRAARKEMLIRRDQPPRKLYHNCSGKHLGLMLLARELGDRVEDYWRRDSRTQREVQRMIASMSDTPEDKISVGVDGCGVPVFAVPFSGIARSYLKLARPELIEDARIREAVEGNVARLHAHPNMIAGADIVDSILTKNPDLIGKSGALGVYAMGIRSLGLGVAVKVMDGSHDEFGPVAIRVLETLHCAPETVKELKKIYPDDIVNDNREIVGCRKAVFELNVL